ncbi:hypothetical protein Pla52o_52620 [Novipirellula galeiformis]|uniref:Uncharacterized protein n=1 Tax=Novipirellula galeiformis TaxID=2528004 RepID=A0A5C6C174_9BACT|nr:hypothetical protein Pla52o_52620 [Novipirellula galeiformis]
MPIELRLCLAIASRSLGHRNQIYRKMSDRKMKRTRPIFLSIIFL